jgi:hypothetical protein
MFRNFYPAKTENILAFSGRSLFAPQYGIVEYWKNAELGPKAEKVFFQNQQNTIKPIIPTFQYSNIPTEPKPLYLVNVQGEFLPFHI